MLRNLKSLLLPAIVCSLGLVVVLTFVDSPKASAAYNSPYLISDSTFRDSGSMSAADIQNFLVTKNSGLKSYSDVEDCGSTGGAHYSYYATYYSCGQSVPASKIIYDAARAYGISPRVILATLQKEQSLVTTPNPTSSQITCAMGYYSCGAYNGFFNQVDGGTWQFRTYMELMSGNNWWGYGPSSYPCKNPSSLYTPGLYPGNDVTFIDHEGHPYTHFVIVNAATAAMYCYTPHVYPGSPTHYYSGSYNFIYWYEAWWGSTISDCPLIDTTDQVYRLYNQNKNDYLYTTNSSEICSAETLYGYLRDGYAFKNTSSSVGGSMPVYRLSAPGGAHFYTIDSAEKTHAQNIGYTYEGVAYYAQPNNTPYYSPIYRILGPAGQHFYTNSLAERDYFLSKLGFVYEGIAYYSPNNTDTSVNVYRLLTPTGRHFYTSSLPEKDYLVTYAGFRMESIEFKGFSASTNSVIPVYRLVGGDKHFITSSPVERNNLVRNSGFKNEAIMYYAPPEGAGGPVYRVYRKGDGDHLFTSSAVEKSVLQGNAGYTYEGVPFATF